MSEIQATLVANTGILVGMKSYDRSLSTHWEYAYSKPFEVSITIFGKESVVWTISRDLLWEGLSSMAGEGDVRVQTLRSEYVMDLSNQNGSIRLCFIGKQVRDFLMKSAALVPFGQESMADMDSMILKLLDGPV